MLRVAEQYAGTDTGRQRRANEDSHLARAPLFVVADGMGGAQAGEVASRIAIESFQDGLQDAAAPEAALAELTQRANAHIHELSHSNAEQAGMGTTLTAVYVGEREISIAHVGDSRAYRLRDGVLERLTEDHSLVDELLRQGRLTPEEALEHPQRSVITRALGPEGAVEVDTRSYSARDGDVYLLCSDGLTTMLAEDRLAELLLRAREPARGGRGADRGSQRGGRARQHHGRAAAPGGARRRHGAADGGIERRTGRAVGLGAAGVGGRGWCSRRCCRCGLVRPRSRRQPSRRRRRRWSVAARARRRAVDKTPSASGEACGARARR